MPIVKSCGICASNLNPEKELKCDLCLLPVHTTCSGLSRSEIACMLAEDRKLSFQCKNCADKGIYNELFELKQLIRALTTEIGKIKDAATIQNVALSPDQTERMISEINERNLRASNVIIYNIDESPAVEPQVRSQHDLTKINEILIKIVDNPPEPVKAFRLGRPTQGKIRPLKVVFKNRYEALEVLKHKRSLPNSSGVKINNDLTIMQRDYLKSLKEKLEAEASQGNTNLSIKYIKGIPTIIKKSDLKNGQRAH